MTANFIFKIASLFADKLSAYRRSQLLQDIANATIESVSEDNSCFIFSLTGYHRPLYEGQQTYGLDGKILDSDGEELDVLLYCDQNNRLLELEFIRWDDKSVMSPSIDTLKVY